jgi:RNA polymerase sigma-70 factor (ECF subfamily)
VRDDDRWGHLPDEELVQRSRAGDEAAFGVLVERHHPVVYRMALSMVSDADLAFDVTQEAFVKAFVALGRFRGDAAFKTWLLSIAANEARGTLRKRARRREQSLEVVGPVVDGGRDPEEQALERTEAERVRRLIQLLPEKQRLSVSLRVEEGMSFKEIGVAIGSSEGAARVNYFHGIRHLRELME